MGTCTKTVRTNFPSSGRDAEANETGCVRMAHSDTNDHATNQTGVVRWRDDGKTQLVQRNEMEPTGIRMEVKQQTCLGTWRGCGD